MAIELVSMVSMLRRALFVGFEAGYSNSDGEKNTFVGYQSGMGATGDMNTFMGYRSGYLEGSGAWNTYIGYRAGEKAVDGSYNTSVGFKTGRWNEASENTFIGSLAGEKNKLGDRNVFIGFKAGKDNRGSDNIFIGAYAGEDSEYRDVSNKFILGTQDISAWLTGDITSTGNLYVNGAPVTTTSSRALKKHIKPFYDFDKALEDIIKTPLFTYQYKNKSDHPEKKRMGIISEELPEHLQIKSKGRLSRPDWPSIYGSIWASLKALHQLITELQNEFFSKIKTIYSQIEVVQKNNDLIQEEFTQIKLTLFQTKNELSETESEIERFRQMVEKHSLEWNEKLARTKEAIEETKREVLSSQKDIKTSRLQMKKGVFKYKGSGVFPLRGSSKDLQRETFQ